MLQRIGGWDAGECDEGRETCFEVAIVDDGGFKEEVCSGLIGRESADGISPKRGILGKKGKSIVFFVERMKTMHRPKGENGSRTGFGEEFFERRQGFGFMTIDEKALGGESPKLIWVTQGCHELFGRGVLK